MAPARIVIVITKDVATIDDMPLFCVLINQMLLTGTSSANSESHACASYCVPFSPRIIGVTRSSLVFVRRVADESVGSGKTIMVASSPMRIVRIGLLPSVFLENVPTLFTVLDEIGKAHV